MFGDRGAIPADAVRVRAMSLHGVIFDLGSTLIHRTGLELEKEKCGVLAEFARAEWGCRDPQRLAARLLEIRLDGWRRSEEELVERLASHSIAQAFTEARSEERRVGKEWRYRGSGYHAEMMRR